jgi:glutamine synthetase
MPKNIDQALLMLESSVLMKKYLTEEYIKLFVELKRKEQDSFRGEISDIEYKWYLNL